MAGLSLGNWGNALMINEPLERCVCTGLAGFLFEDQAGGGRTVAIGCSTCGIRTESFPLNQAEDAVLAWEAGDFADESPAQSGGVLVPQEGHAGVKRAHGRTTAPVRI
jgi:hypothetical protein